MPEKALAILLLAGLAAEQPVFAGQVAPNAPKGVEISWSELSALVVEQNVSTVLPDGTRLSGDVLAVRPESLVMDVHRSSRKKLYPIGQNEIPRTSVNEIRLIRHRSAAMRIVGGILGGVGGMFAVTGLAFATDSAAVVIPGLLIIIPVAAVSGYYAGKLADRRTTRIQVKKESAEPGRKEAGL